MTDTTDFSFADHARDFQEHISSSIPGYEDGLIPTCISLSRRFMQPDTAVLDVGCSDGRLLSRIRKANQATRPSVRYIGIDIEPSFEESWEHSKAENLQFQVADARAFHGYTNLSICLSHFTLQFIRPADKIPLLHRFAEGLVEGGALMIAEKTLAETARFQDAMTFPHYDLKLANGFNEKDVLDKERSLRGQMTLWTEQELRDALRQVGFREVQAIWRSFMFVGYLALK